ncbi:MAG: 30S ribosomal protein S7 [Candidatus Portnoybacteria bacterium CG_4_8_14_3_um_filter_44_10]|uniref:Small ribosomal subunit protein uS7 n=5 Tax=Candidatus Portnoyibacteriota TaxID=1817913 RepID=A0A2H0KP25_9BACT|nr:MAG: 30S ribosomal protein S7 [Parcubacteria group bacterium CG2_30_44_18]PIQ73918.1 MAG: 30S ribosomal protein S7 [Candidatus Portnoybacteria bacterium CG11_big_fil_rev_8_21_14_0_20_44_10]PIS17151.1 MAG: 30S ribosomal protein S7 [Candidatus Portnoybacteria bacterium CG09_land_8_20_14_0_10_44_13]PIW75153.1 MAG: 30S ribosomal protein S7 [Candidatus Portnoybacteria bacterium CG_4_8_14_3_um_filter_44_10]PIZ69818.1 MAG: 30S ribosomal protein S7 [Candidatus Portnoybacteria bacterium CG_4_10_14_0_
MRRRPSVPRQIQPDPRHQNVMVAKFINYLMDGGKKTTASKVLYDAFDILTKQTKDPLEVFDQAIKNVMPAVEVRSKRVGGANYQVPREVRGERKISLAFRWIIAAAKKKKGKPMAEKMAQELLEASQNAGDAVKKRMDTHRMADANKAFAHFRW